MCVFWKDTRREFEMEPGDGRETKPSADRGPAAAVFTQNPKKRFTAAARDLDKDDGGLQDEERRVSRDFCAR